MICPAPTYTVAGV